MSLGLSSIILVLGAILTVENWYMHVVRPPGEYIEKNWWKSWLVAKLDEPRIIPLSTAVIIVSAILVFNYFQYSALVYWGAVVFLIWNVGNDTYAIIRKTFFSS